MSSSNLIATKRRRWMHGFSIVELMVAMTLSLILLAGVISVFTSSRSSFETVDRLSRTQENGRFALDEIVRDVRSAGFIGCAKSIPISNSTLNTPTDVYWNFLTPLGGFDASGATWSPTIPNDSGGSPIAVSPSTGSDILVLHIPKRGAVALPLQADMASSTSTLSLPNISPAPLQSKDIAMITNCEAQAIFEVGAYTTGTVTHPVSSATAGISPGNATNDLVYPFFRVGSQVVPIQTVIYYVRAGVNGNSLWRREGIAAAQELVEGIDQMQLLFGVDTNGDQIIDQYSVASAVTNWTNVINVRIALLARSLDEYGGQRDTKTYTLVDSATTAGPFNDRRMRQVFVTTATLRNKTL